MAVKDIQKKTIADLEKDLKEKRSSLRDMRFGAAGAKTKDTGLKSKARRDIARILTELKNR
ncbi:MAG: 50S ribosomal protein L29 [Candidatus Paceibacterota bacterium]